MYEKIYKKHEIVENFTRTPCPLGSFFRNVVEPYGNERYFTAAGKQSGKEPFFSSIFMNHL